MTTSEHSEPDKPLAVPLSDQLGQAPERDAFEAWAKDQGFDVTTLDGFGGEFAGYRDLRTHGAWEGYCVGVAAELERWRTQVQHLFDARHRYGWSPEVDAEIEALGQMLRPNAMVSGRPEAKP